ncbi:hypothetical protein SERLA73DRAFT_70032 [Serpula lacrymans var. lacrymans S7.3]|uniref:Uncharacterized protein n=1 Tax=Serpula lacrymans var. lacrymans (strain S7.3) TaxID=936435 RepID=F8PLP7_SERL3|nr:hypothetical protein SERLA73DRAFT_70032 [Serpula lacrymans var. lacrymans S7.3]
MSSQTSATKLLIQIGVASGKNNNVSGVAEVLANVHLDHADVKLKLNGIEEYLDAQFNAVTNWFSLVDNQLHSLTHKVDKCN